MQQRAAATSSKRIEFTGDLSTAPSTLPHFWEHTVGSAHAPIALRADWQDQLRRAHYELGFHYVRFHGLLSDQMGTLICHIITPPTRSANPATTLSHN
jgi:xylan 1,4-beta-xylosidase